jgi:hypothetical protein
VDVSKSAVRVRAAPAPTRFQAGAGGRTADVSDKVRAAQFGAQAQLFPFSSPVIVRKQPHGRKRTL